MRIIALIVLVLAVFCNGKTSDDVLCPGNRFVFLSTYVLGMQTDLKLAFADINKSIKIDEVFYQEEIYRSYRIYNISQNIIYNQGKQYAKLAQKNVLRVTGGTVRIEFTFNWTKTQLGVSLNGSGTGSTVSNITTYEKTLQTNISHELQWHLSYSQPLVLNSFALNTVDPYRKADYEILSDMLNKLKNNQTTVRDNFIKAINANFQNILAVKVQEDQTIKFEKTIHYTWNDYHGPFEIFYNNTLMNSTLAEDGLYLLFSQVIQSEEDFECGDPVPFQPNDPSAFGGMQQFLSNSLLKSTMRKAIHQGALDVNLTQQFWQSRAFQFFVGDLHDVMPTATKHIQTLTSITGKCRALDDPVLSFAMKNSKSYEAKVNFACFLQFNKTTFTNINLVATYEISPKLSSKVLDIQITNIGGTPAFIESPPYKIEYQELADFMVSETIGIAKNGFVYGTGYKMKYPRKYPTLNVKPSYLFLFDASATPKKIIDS